MTNLCEKLECPHAQKKGCERYPTSCQCPIGKLEGRDRNPAVKSDARFLYVEEGAQVDIPGMLFTLMTDVVSRDLLTLTARVCGDRRAKEWLEKYPLP